MADPAPAPASVPPGDPWRLHAPAGAPVDPALGGALRVAPPSGAGALIVATDALLAHAERLTALATGLASDARRLAGLPSLPAAAASGSPSLHRAAEPGPAVRAVRGAAEMSERVRASLQSAIEAYSLVEAEQRVRMLGLGESLGVALAPVIRALVLTGLPVLAMSRIAGLPGGDDLAELGRWVTEHPELVTSPAFVEAVRAAAMAVDETAGAAVGLPPAAIGAEAARHGFQGVEAGAALLLGAAAPFGLLREGPVSVDRVATLPLEGGPRGAAERLARVPEGDQVRIERYEAPGRPPRYVVYVGPTETFSPVPGDEPWDLASNIAGVAGLSAGSIRATEAAMHDAGIATTDEVQLVGFSQGGLVATRLAADGAWNARGLETYGAPAGNVALPAHLAGMAVRNSDDFVPALAGPQLDRHLLQVERQAFAPGSPIPHELPAPAHQRSAYVATATEIDGAQSEAVRAQVRAMDAFTADYTQREGSQVTVMLYHAERGAEVARGEHVRQEPPTSGGSIR